MNPKLFIVTRMFRKQVVTRLKFSRRSNGVRSQNQHIVNCFTGSALSRGELRFVEAKRSNAVEN